MRAIWIIQIKNTNANTKHIIEQFIVRDWRFERSFTFERRRKKKNAHNFISNRFVWFVGWFIGSQWINNDANAQVNLIWWLINSVAFVCLCNYNFWFYTVFIPLPFFPSVKSLQQLFSTILRCSVRIGRFIFYDLKQTNYCKLCIVRLWKCYGQRNS